MAVNVKIKKVDTSAVRRRFTAMTRRSQNFQPVFRWVMQELQKAHRQNFRSQGAASGFPWQPLTPQYASWKTANYGSKGILVRSGDLENSLTMNSGRGSVRDIGLRSAEFGTKLWYAKFHQSGGTQNLPQRKPVFRPPRMAHETAVVVGEYIVHGSVGVKYADAMKGFVI